MQKPGVVTTPKLQGKALLTGASGFIGGRLRDSLLAQGVDVLAIRRRGSPEAKKGRSVALEYDDREGLSRLMRNEKPDYVFHVAGATKGVTLDDFRRANVMPTENLVAALKSDHPGVKRFVFMSSLTSYGPSSALRPLVETETRRPIEFYGESKLEAEQAVEAAGSSIPWTILRPGGVYGPGDADYFNLFLQVARGLNVFFGNRKRWFSAVYADDLVDASILAADHPGAVGEGFFVSDGEPVTWECFQSTIVTAFQETGKRKAWDLDLPEAFVSIAAAGGELATRFDHKPRLFNKQKAKMGAQEAWTCEVGKIKERLGFEAAVKVDEGVRRSLDWYRGEKWL